MLTHISILSLDIKNKIEILSLIRKICLFNSNYLLYALLYPSDFLSILTSIESYINETYQFVKIGNLEGIENIYRLLYISLITNSVYQLNRDLTNDQVPNLYIFSENCFSK